MNRLEKSAVALLPLAGIMPQVTKESIIFQPPELIILKSGITAVTTGLLLYSEALRRRQMEAAHTRDRNLSKAGMALITAGVAATLYALWAI